MLTQPPIIQQGDNREQETKMETAVKHAVVLCGPRLPNICFSPVNVWFGPAASTHLLLAVLLPEAAISGLLWASFRWRFKRRKKKKKNVPLQAKEDEQSGSKATAARESWYKHQEHFTSYAGVTGQQEAVRLYLAGQFLQVSSDWRPPHQKKEEI